MGKKYNVPQQDVSKTGHEIELPIHLMCKSRPQYNKSINLRVMYSPNTYLYDLLKQIEDYVSNSLHKELKLDFEIGTISKRSFINKNVVMNDYKNKNWLKSQMQYESITNYKQKDIIKKGVHIVIRRVDETGDHGMAEDEYEEPELSVDSDGFNEMRKIRKPLQVLSMNSNNNSSNGIITENIKKREKTLDQRLNELCLSDDVAYSNFDDIMYNFRKKEESLYLEIDENYIENKQTSITWTMRSVLIDWLYDLQIDLDLNNETLFAAINYIDLFLSKCIISRQNLQLLGVTAIMISSKTYEIIPQPINEWIYLSHDQYTRKQMTNLEKKILKQINWNVFQVTPYIYIKPWLQILEIKNKSKEKLIIDLLIQSVSLNKVYLGIKISKLVTSIFYLCSIYLKSKFSKSLLSTISKYNPTESKSINNIIIQLNEILCNLIKKGEKDSMTSAIYRKFTDKKYLQKRYVYIDIKLFGFNRIFKEFKQNKV